MEALHQQSVKTVLRYTCKESRMNDSYCPEKPRSSECAYFSVACVLVLVEACVFDP